MSVYGDMVFLMKCCCDVRKCVASDIEVGKTMQLEGEE